MGNVTWRETAALREELFDSLEVRGAICLRLDVRAVSSIDRSGIALLVGANHRATATGRQLVLIDANGVVTKALSRMRLAKEFAITQAVTPAAAGGREVAANRNGLTAPAMPAGVPVHRSATPAA